MQSPVKTNNELMSVAEYDAIQWQESVGCAAFEPGKSRTVAANENTHPLPKGNHRWELSWSVQENIMRIRHPESGIEWKFHEMLGHIFVPGVNDLTHRINMYGQAQLKDGILYLFSPVGMATPKIPNGQYLPKSVYRLCANIAGNNWRLRDEPTNRLVMVAGYTGSLHANWLDRSSHIFHIDDGVICADNVFHFIDSALEDWEWEDSSVEHHCKALRAV